MRKIAANNGPSYTHEDVCAASALLNKGAGTALDILGATPVLGSLSKGAQAAVNGVQLTGGIVSAGMAVFGGTLLDGGLYLMHAWYWGLSGNHTPVHGLWTYGNWCGTGGSGVPINGVDGGCMVHDYCYNLNGLSASGNVFTTNPALQACNQALCNSAWSVVQSVNSSNYGSLADEGDAAMDIASYFSGFANIVRSGNRCHVP